MAVLAFCHSRPAHPLRNLAVLFIGQQPHHRHHSHHSSAPIFCESMRLRFFHQFVHSHFHECILRKTRSTFRVFRHRRRVPMRELRARRQRLHLLHCAFFGQV